jgi:hypothetical protein
MTDEEDLTLTLTMADRQLLVRVLTSAMERGWSMTGADARETFNAMVQLRAIISGHISSDPAQPFRWQP